MIPASTIARLATLGLSAEQATAVAEMMAEVEAATESKAGAAIEARRASDRERKAKQRHGMSRDITGRPVTGRDGADPAPPPSPSPLEPPTPPTPTPMREAARTREASGSAVSLEGKLRQAAKAEENPSPGLCDLSPILGLLDAGFDLERDILPVIRSRPNRKLRSWGWYVDAVRDGADRRQAAANTPAPRPAFLKPLDDLGKPRIDFGGGYSAPESTVVDVIRKGHWLPQWGAKRGEPGCKVPERLFEEAAA